MVPAPTGPRPLLTAPQVAEILGLSLRQVRRLTPSLGGFQVAERRAMRFDPERVEAWIEKRKAEADARRVQA